MNKKLNKKGFTIVELVIVIAVIAILAAVLIPTFSSIVDKANESKALQEAKNAYTNAVAEDMTNDPEATDLVYGKTEVIIDCGNGILVSIDPDTTAAAIVTTGTANFTLVDGALVAKTAG